MSSSAHIDNKKKDILVLGKGTTQGLEHTLTAEKMYPINFTVTKNFFAQACITMEQIATYLLMVKKLQSLKEKILKLQQAHYVQELFLKTGQQII